MRIFDLAIAFAAFAGNVHVAADGCGDGDVNVVYDALEACSLSSICWSYLQYTTSISTTFITVSPVQTISATNTSTTDVFITLKTTIITTETDFSTSTKIETDTTTVTSTTDVITIVTETPTTTKVVGQVSATTTTTNVINVQGRSEPTPTWCSEIPSSEKSLLPSKVFSSACSCYVSMPISISTGTVTQSETSIAVTVVTSTDTVTATTQTDTETFTTVSVVDVTTFTTEAVTSTESDFGTATVEASPVTESVTTTTTVTLTQTSDNAPTPTCTNIVPCPSDGTIQNFYLVGYGSGTIFDCTFVGLIPDNGFLAGEMGHTLGDAASFSIDQNNGHWIYDDTYLAQGNTGGANTIMAFSQTNLGYTYVTDCTVDDTGEFICTLGTWNTFAVFDGDLDMVYENLQGEDGITTFYLKASCNS